MAERWATLTEIETSWSLWGIYQAHLALDAITAARQADAKEK